MKEIDKNIKENNFYHVYLLYGEEDYLKLRYRDRLLLAMSADDMNTSRYQGKGIDVAELLDNSRTLPFFAERKVILIENSGFFKGANEEVYNLVTTAPDSTVFIFVEDEVDARGKLYKYVAKEGHAAEMKAQTEKDLMTWCARQLAAYDKRITRDDCMYFLKKTGTDMNNAYNELQKLIYYVGSSDVITAQDIDAVCTVNPEDKVFDMINAMTLGDKDTAIRLYSDLLALKEPPIKILVLISRQYDKLLSVKSMLEDNNGRQAITDRLGIRPYFVNGYISQASHYSVGELHRALEDCVKAEADIKMGILPEQMAVELLILKYCNRSEA